MILLDSFNTFEQQKAIEIYNIQMQLAAILKMAAMSAILDDIAWLSLSLITNISKEYSCHVSCFPHKVHDFSTEWPHYNHKM